MVDAVRRILGGVPEAKIIIWSGRLEDDPDVQAALKEGATRYISKISAVQDSLVPVIRELLG